MHHPTTTFAPSHASAVAEVFATETMAELCVRQGRVGEAVAIYRRLIADPSRGARHGQWLERLGALESAGPSTKQPSEKIEDGTRPPNGLRDADLRTMRAIETMATQLADLQLSERFIPGRAAPAPLAPGSPGAPSVATSSAPNAAPVSAPPEPRLSLLIHEPVRSGQIVYAQGADLIVLAAVNPGAQLLADGNIHVYGPLRGRAIAGAKGASGARVFCRRLDAEMVGIDVAYIMADDIPRTAIGKPAQIFLEAGRCVVLALY